MKIFLRPIGIVLSGLLLLLIPSCQQAPTEPLLSSEPSLNNSGTKLSKVTLMEDFEAGSKTAYAVGDVTFSTGVWTLDDALVGTLANDAKVGAKSIRVRNSGIVTMKFDLIDGVSTVSVKHASYGTDASTTWGLWYSTDSGSTWTQAGASITTSSTTLQTATFTINITGTIRFELRKTDGTSNRVNFDDFTVNDYVVQTSGITEDFEAGSKTAYAVGDVTFSTGVWTLDDALVGTLASDAKTGAKSVRVRNSGIVTMKFDRTSGAGTVSIKHAIYGSDAASTWSLWYSTDGGTTWAQTGAPVTTSSTTLQTATFTINITGTIRFEIRKTDGTSNRVNFDDFSITDYVVSTVSLAEDFEAGTKTAYAVGDVTFATGVWTLDDALVGTLASDAKTGAKSIRVRNSGIVTMKFDHASGAATVSVKHGSYGTDASTTWGLWYSTNSGTTWIQAGASVTTSSTTLQTATFTVNVTGPVRFELRKTDGTSNRVNFDDFTINGNTGGGSTGGLTETEPNNSTSTANAIISIPASLTGYISSTTDVDYFSISNVSGDIISSSLTVPSGVDYNLYILNSSGTTVASSTNTTGLSESIAYTTTTAGPYYILVSSTLGSSTTASYTLTANVTAGGTGGGTDTTTSTTVHLTLGNPSIAVQDINFPLNYLMEKPQYSLSYNRDKGIPNWTAWHLNASWLGSTPRQNDFRNDTSLPAGWYQVQSTSFSGSGYDRGHMCPSADRTLTVADNSATFYMTNMIPQAPNNNRGPWANLESYCRTLVSQGKELYIYSGGYGTQGTLDSGRVNIPARTWKVIVVLDEGTNDLSRVTTTTRLIAIDMTNNNAQISSTADWKTFRVSVDYVEAQTGFDFLSKVSTSIQAAIESVVDNQ